MRTNLLEFPMWDAGPKLRHTPRCSVASVPTAYWSIEDQRKYKMHVHRILPPWVATHAFPISDLPDEWAEFFKAGVPSAHLDASELWVLYCVPHIWKCCCIFSASSSRAMVRRKGSKLFGCWLSLVRWFGWGSKLVGCCSKVEQQAIFPFNGPAHVHQQNPNLI